MDDRTKFDTAATLDATARAIRAALVLGLSLAFTICMIAALVGLLAAH